MVGSSTSSTLIYLYSLTVLGVVRRRCIGGNDWEEFNECFKEQTVKLLNQVVIMILINFLELHTIYILGHEPNFIVKGIK